MSKRLLAIGVVSVVLAVVAMRFCKGDATHSDDTHSSEAAHSEAAIAEPRESLTPAMRLEAKGKQAGVMATVKGRVIDASSKEPVAWVDVVFSANRQEASTTSDGDGRYQIELSPGVYDIRAVGERVIAKKSPRLRIGGKREVSQNLLVEQLSTVRGRAISPDGVGLEGVDISLRADSGSGKKYPNRGEIGLGVSESDGSFELLVPPGAAALEAVLGETTVFTEVAAVASGGTIDDVTIVIDQRGVIGGSVYLPNGEGASGATVLITQRRTGTSHFVHKRIEAGGDGRFRVTGLAPVEYAVEALMDGHGSSAPFMLALSPEQLEVDIELTLHKPESLAGLVQDQDGRPLGGVRVSQVRQGSRQFYAKVETGMDGTFEFTDIAPGPHRLRATKDGYGQGALNDVMATKTDIVMKLAASGSLRGVVSNAAGPIEGFVVRYRLASKKPSPKNETSASFAAEDGSFVIYPIDPGTYWVRISAKGFADVERSAVEVSPGGVGDASVTLKE